MGHRLCHNGAAGLAVSGVAGLSVPHTYADTNADVHDRYPADTIPNARFEVIAGAGHSAYWEQPDRWNNIVLNFLKEHL